MLILYLFSLLTLLVGSNGLPYVIPVEGTQFDLTRHTADLTFEQRLAQFQQAYGEDFSDEAFNMLYDINDQIQDALVKRDLESTIESVLRMVNDSGIIWNLLDSVSDSPRTIDFIANLTSGLIINAAGGNSQGSSNSSFDLSLVSGVFRGLNLTRLLDAVADSGLVTSVLDGLLLDENFRPTLVDLIYNVTESNKELIYYLIVHYLGDPNSNQKRDNQGSLLAFVGNVVGSFLSSNAFNSGLESILTALNDSGIVVYTIQRFLSTPSYINMTGHLVSEVVGDVRGKVSLDGLGINITSIVQNVLKDPAAITGLLGGVLGDLGSSNGNSIVQSAWNRYRSGITAIIRDLEDKGLFVDLNNYIFSSAAAAATATATGNSREVGHKDAEVTSISASSTAQASSSSRDSAARVSTLKCLIWIQPVLGYLFFF